MIMMKYVDFHVIYMGALGYLVTAFIPSPIGIVIMYLILQWNVFLWYVLDRNRRNVVPFIVNSCIAIGFGLIALAAQHTLAPAIFKHK